jgi:hypothetical protein
MKETSPILAAPAPAAAPSARRASRKPAARSPQGSAARARPCEPDAAEVLMESILGTFGPRWEW